MDGQDLAQVTIGSYRQHIALVPQKIALSFGNIAENIAYVMPNADYTLNQEAAKKAGLRVKLRIGSGEHPFRQ